MDFIYLENKDYYPEQMPRKVLFTIATWQLLEQHVRKRLVELSQQLSRSATHDEGAGAGAGDGALVQPWKLTSTQGQEPEQRQDKLGNLSMSILEKVSKIYAW